MTPRPQLIFFIIFLLASISQVSAAATAKIIFSTSNNPAIGKPLLVTVDVETGNEQTSAASLVVQFPSFLRFVRLDDTGSIFETALSDPNVKADSVTFARVHIGEGFTGKGRVATLIFEPKTAGSGTISLNAASSEITNYNDDSNMLDPTTSTATLVVNVPEEAFATPQPQATSTQTTASKTNLENATTNATPNPLLDASPSTSLRPTRSLNQSTHQITPSPDIFPLTASPQAPPSSPRFSPQVFLWLGATLMLMSGLLISLYYPKEGKLRHRVWRWLTKDRSLGHAKHATKHTHRHTHLHKSP